MEYLPYFHDNQAACLSGLAQGLPLLIKLGYSGGAFYNLKLYFSFYTCVQNPSETHSNYIVSLGFYRPSAKGGDKQGCLSHNTQGVHFD